MIKFKNMRGSIPKQIFTWFYDFLDSLKVYYRLNAFHGCLKFFIEMWLNINNTNIKNSNSYRILL